MEGIKVVKVVCQRCGYTWLSRYDPKKVYYQCPKCMYENKVTNPQVIET